MSHLCAEPGCPVVLEEGPGRCHDHRAASSSGSRGYGTRWRRLRDAYIAEHPDCEECGEPAIDVDHLDEARPGDPTFYDWNNLGSKCRSCHRRKTEHAKQRRRAGVAA